MLKGHDDHVITCLEFSGTKVVSGSDDNTLKVWSAVTGKVCHKLALYAYKNKNMIRLFHKDNMCQLGQICVN